MQSGTLATDVDKTTNPARRFGRRELQAQARAAVLGGILLFVALQLGMRAWIEWGKPEMRDPGFEIKYRRYAELRDKAERTPALIAFFGSSMTAHGMKADMIDAPLTEALGRPAVGFNFASPGGGIFTQMIFLQRLCRRGDRPELAVIELAPMVFDKTQGRDLARLPAYVLDRHDRDTVERHVDSPDFRTEWWQSFLVPVYGHRLSILSQSADLFVPFADRLELPDAIDDHGWHRLAPLPADEHNRILSQVEQKYAVRFGKYDLAPWSVEYLRELIAFLRHERIPTVMVLMPAGPRLRALYSREHLAPLYAEFEALSRSSGFPLIDAQQLCSEDKFIDSFHLNDVGAAELTQFLLKHAIVPHGRSAERPQP